MSGNFGDSFPKHPNPEKAPINHDWGVSVYPQPSPFNFAAAETIPAREGPSKPNIRHVNAKVAIPRTSQPSSWTSSGRVSRACENCREQKAKCSGHRPACHRCQDAGVRCSYGDRKRERMMKQLNDLTTQVETYDALLRNLYPKLGASLARQVDQTLRDLNSRPLIAQAKVPSPVLSTPSNNAQHLSILSSSADVSSMVASSGAVDYTEEDFNRDEKVQAVGFVGEHSEMAWLYRLKRDLDRETFKSIKEVSERPPISSVTFFQDDSGILVFDDIDLARRPPQHIANGLMDAYFHVVHPEFPIIGKTIFLNQYRSFYMNPNVRPGKRWIAMLNLVFAIATRHALLVDQPQPDCDDHQTYFERAWRLSVGNVLLDHPDLQQAQVEGLAAFYLLSVGQVNRSWRIIGLAIRSAATMGLNIRSETESITHFSKELRYRVWWALFMLDICLCEMTGRPLSTRDIFCTTPLPVPFQEEEFCDERVVQVITNQENRNAFFTSLFINTPIDSPTEGVALKSPAQQGKGKGKQQERPNQMGAMDFTPNTSLCFLYAVDLAHILRDAIDILYAPGSTRQSWHDIETAISMLNNHADNWLSRLPAEFHFITLDRTHQFVRQCVSLAFRFYATKLIILQPCFRRLSQSSSEATSPGTLCDQMAAMCVQMAGQMVDMLPEVPDLDWLYGVTPWWCILHNIMQSTTILLTWLFMRSHLSPPNPADIIRHIQKAIRWLKEMSTKDPCSQKAWIVCVDILSRHGLKFGFNLDLEL
ncbi:hypothetical protein N7457_006953 [Penicillium paradoxum]|uniref:uncharacterized protein n=1 Tax=Penicillium paradoxum TaxID=176176 RepID=UPI00254763D3|nr:uncharacterized protein N7457_006953 [Penicillium paradoxum]KAJ5779233.1 hypothetical protein N7457_006953 [Penicillium paradoxum]